MSKQSLPIQLRDIRISDLDVLYEQQTDKEAIKMTVFI